MPTEFAIRANLFKRDKPTDPTRLMRTNQLKRIEGGAARPKVVGANRWKTTGGSAVEAYCDAFQSLPRCQSFQK